VLECQNEGHYNWIDFSDSDIWQGGWHGLSCSYNLCSEHHGWYYECGGEEECGGGLCVPSGGGDDPEAALRLDDELVLEDELVRYARAKPHRIYVDLERNLVRGLACNGTIAANYKVSPETALLIAEITAPELIGLR
jgi:hypothetical protein